MKKIKKASRDISPLVESLDDRLLGASDAMAFLNAPKTTFYRNIRRGIYPKPRYSGITPLWKLSDLKGVHAQLPEKPFVASALSSSR